VSKRKATVEKAFIGPSVVILGRRAGEHLQVNCKSELTWWGGTCLKFWPPGRLRQEDCDFEGSLSNIAISWPIWDKQ
jgi:hypothetical protein